MLLRSKTGRSRVRLTVLVLLVCTSLAGVSYPAADLHLRAAALLLRIENGRIDGALAGYGTHGVDEAAINIGATAGNLRARIYTPRGVSHPPGMVIVHGVHRLGIEEPRLVNFSRALAAGGIAVLTPELAALADYHVDEKEIGIIGEAAHELRRRVGARVGVLGLSFAGGLSLLAAADPRFASDIGFVVAVGAHDNLESVCRYLATGRITRPDGSTQVLSPHEYGALVLVYSHIEDFFSAADAPAARDAIRLQLWEQVDDARRRAEQLSPEGRAKMQLLLHQTREALAPELLARIPLHANEMARVSPRSRLGPIDVPVLILHGAGDSVIPAAEALWLAQDVPPKHLRNLLISPLITHVEVGKQPSWRDKLALLNFMADMLAESDRLRPAS